MIHRLLKTLDRIVGFEPAKAHCDIPCKVYDPHGAQIAALSVIRFMDLIQPMAEKTTLTLAEQATLSRLVREKEEHAAKVKDEIRVIWGDYFKAPQLAAFPDTHALVHSIMQTASACKQHLNRSDAEQLLTLVNRFAANFWATKGIDTFDATCPYPPDMQVTYPKLA